MHWDSSVHGKLLCLGDPSQNPPTIFFFLNNLETSNKALTVQEFTPEDSKPFADFLQFNPSSNFITGAQSRRDEQRCAVEKTLTAFHLKISKTLTNALTLL